MKCTACQEKIEIYEFDMLNAIEEINPVTFRSGTFHLECYKLLIETAEQMKSNNYLNRLDEYYSRDLQKISI